MAAEKTIVRVYHDFYGCESGCCGHTVEVKRPMGRVDSKFEFKHPYGADAKKWAVEFAKNVVRERWPECFESIDWESVEIDRVTENC